MSDNSKLARDIVDANPVAFWLIKAISKTLDDKDKQVRELEQRLSAYEMTDEEKSAVNEFVEHVRQKGHPVAFTVSNTIVVNRSTMERIRDLNNLNWAKFAGMIDSTETFGAPTAEELIKHCEVGVGRTLSLGELLDEILKESK